MTSLDRAAEALKALYPRMSLRRRELVARTVLAAARAPASGTIGENGEARFPDPEP